MRRTFSLWFWGVLILIIAKVIWVPASANVGVLASAGKGLHVEDVRALRAAFNWDFGMMFFREDPWGLNVHWENALGYWRGPSTETRPNDSLYFVTTGPVFRLQPHTPYGQWFLPYGEAGVSPSWLTQREIAGRKLSIHFQFEDKIGFGCRLGKNQKIDLGYRFIHYSNASIKRPNSGVNIQMINLGYWFS